MHGVALRCVAVRFFATELRCFVVFKIHMMMCACRKVGRVLEGGYTRWDGRGRVGYGLVLWICIIFSCWNGKWEMGNGNVKTIIIHAFTKQSEFMSVGVHQMSRGMQQGSH